MQPIPFIKKFVTCVLAGLVIGAAALRLAVTFFRDQIPARLISGIPFVLLVTAIVSALIWQFRKTNNQSTLAFWQGLIRYGVAFDLATFGWEKIFHLQLVMPLSDLDLPYNRFSPAELFWNFFGYSYLFGCIVAGIQIIGAMLLLFHKTRLVGAFILLPVLVNILLMDIFYQIGGSVVVHASIMTAGILYCLLIEFNRLKAFFLSAVNPLPTLQFSRYKKLIIRLSIIYIPLLLIALHGKTDKYPGLTGKYEVKRLSINRQLQHQDSCSESILTVVYFDVKNGCVFQFNTPAKRWNGTFSIDSNHLEISWRSPAAKPVFKGTLSAGDGPGKLILTGMLGKDSMDIILQKIAGKSPQNQQNNRPPPVSKDIPLIYQFHFFTLAHKSVTPSKRVVCNYFHPKVVQSVTFI